MQELDPIKAKSIVVFLNSLLDIDGEAVTNLFSYRVPCNQELANHPTVQVLPPLTGTEDPPLVGMLGLLNGLCGVFNQGPMENQGSIVMNIKSNGELIAFSLVDNSGVPVDA